MQLSKSKQEWAEDRAGSLKGYLLGSAISKNKHSDVYYRTALDKEMDKFIESCLKDLNKVYSVLPALKTPASNNAKPSIAQVRIVLNKYKSAKAKILWSNCYRIVKKWLKLAQNSADSSIKKMLTQMAGKKLAIEYDKSLDEMLKLIIQRNVQLIKNTTSQTLTNIENIVYNGVTRGRGWADIQDELYHQKHISKDRVKRIARDQTAKTNGALNQLAQQQAGIKYFMWWGVEDERERELHWKLNGKIFKWGDSPERLPIIDKVGTRGYPSEAVLCRCVSRPVFLLDKYKTRWLGDNKGYEVIKK